jgi:hypothetical protein
LKTAEPAIRIWAPASTMSGAVWAVMPPSTSKGTSVNSLRRLNYSTISVMKVWPPKQGFTLMTFM